MLVNRQGESSRDAVRSLLPSAGRPCTSTSASTRTCPSTCACTRTRTCAYIHARDGASGGDFDDRPALQPDDWEAAATPSASTSASACGC